MNCPKSSTLLVLAGLCLASFGCGNGDISGSPAGTGGVDRADGAGGSLVLPGLGFVASSFGFYYPEDPETSLDGFVTIEGSFAIGYRNGDSYAGFIANPSKNTAEFSYVGGASINITDNGYLETGGGVALVNVGGGDGAKNVVEIPFYLGGGYTYEGKVLVDIFAQFGFQPLMTANGPQGRDTFNVGDDWYITLGATVHTRELFGKNEK